MTDPKSVLTKRHRLSRLAGQHFGGDRDLYKIMGYPEHLLPADYTEVYLRQDIAARIVDAFPDATWREPPEVLGEEDFVKTWRQLEDKHRIWRMFHRLDRLTGLGHYGVLLLGLDGGEPMWKPAERNDYNLLYVQPHSERTAEILEWEDNAASPRFGMPKKYRITTGVNWTGTGAGQKSLTVHHSRVIHIAERALEDVSIGTPRLERIYNRLMDLDKLLGGGAEIYWQNAAMLLSFNADKDVEWQEDEQAAMADQLEEMQHGLRRMLRLRGVEAENLAPGMQGADPTPFIDKTLDAIAGAAGIPKRILIGSERGELSSEQDENNWAARIEERREQFAGPAVVDAFIDRGERLGFLPRGYQALQWAEADTLGEEKRATIADYKAAALQKYLSAPGADMIVSPDEMREWLGLEGSAPMMPDEDAEGEDDSETVAQFEAHKKARGQQ